MERIYPDPVPPPRFPLPPQVIEPRDDEHVLYPLYERLESYEKKHLSFDSFLDLYATEALLRRISLLPDAEEVVLRGSLLTRQWVKPALRCAQDIDFLLTDDWSGEKIQDFLERACMVKGVEDEANFLQPGSDFPLPYGLEPIWEYGVHPGTRGDIFCYLGKHRANIQIDLAFGDTLLPPAEYIDYPSLRPGEPIRIQAIRPELQIAWKIHGLFEVSDWRTRWRAKDLWDIYLIYKNCLDDLDGPMFAQALRHHFQERDTSLGLINHLIENTFIEKFGAITWQDFCDASENPELPEDPREVVAAIAPLVRLLYWF
jgi:hypothetical protein